MRELKQLEDGIDIAEYKAEFKKDRKILDADVGPRYAIWENGKRFIYCPKCRSYESEEKFNDCADFPTGKKMWCKKHEIKITTTKGDLGKNQPVTQEMCMEMPEMNPAGCEAARNRVKAIKEMFKWKLEDLFTPFDINYQGLFVADGSDLYNF